MRVSFYFDPVCPWCWITARWLIDVRRRRPLEIDWRSFSLEIKNDGVQESDRWNASQREGRRALRVVEATRAEAGAPAVEGLYVEMARRWHHDGERGFDFESILRRAGIDIAPGSADDQRWDRPIEAAMSEAMGVAGDDVGVPIIVLEGADPVGFYGPIMSPAPTGPEAAELFDHLVAIARVPGFFELKRGRDVPPETGERP